LASLLLDCLTYDEERYAGESSDNQHHGEQELGL
jgi:hypothetical protein